MSSQPMPSYNPNYGQSPDGGFGAPPAVPSLVNTAYWLILAAALMQVIAAIMGAVYAGSPEMKQRIQDQLQGQNISADAAATAQTVGVVTVLVVGLISVVIYVLIAIFIRKGMNWARITGTVLAVISLYQLASLTFPAGIFVLLQVALGIVAIILCWLKESNAYFVGMKQHRAALKNR